MKTFLSVLLTLGLFVCEAQNQTKKKAATAATEKPAATKPVSLSERLNYSIGVSIARKMATDSMEILPDMFSEGLKTIAKGNGALMSDEEISLTFQEFDQLRRRNEEPEDSEEYVDSSAAEGEIEDGEAAVDSAAETEEDPAVLAGPNIAKGKAFLQANKSNKGVVELPSGLQYQIIRKGKGASPKAGSKVLAHYIGTHLDGTVFDSSFERKTPIVIPVDGVIAGWTEALQLMNPGSKWKLFIPSHLAYGNEGSSPIEPGETVIFDVELLYFTD
jgi:FKBP-type peptidyl-prolyl cis-trans isomerase FklB